jgi:hypothetical protein
MFPYGAEYYLDDVDGWIGVVMPRQCTTLRLQHESERRIEGARLRVYVTGESRLIKLTHVTQSLIDFARSTPLYPLLDNYSRSPR